MSLLHHQLKDYAQALTHAQQALILFEQLGDRLGQAFSQMNLGRAYSGLQEWVAAKDAYSIALTLREELGQQHLVAEVQAGLATVLWQLGDLDTALLLVNDVLLHLEETMTDGLEALGSVCWSCYQNPEHMWQHGESQCCANDSPPLSLQMC